MNINGAPNISVFDRWNKINDDERYVMVGGAVVVKKIQDITLYEKISGATILGRNVREMHRIMSNKAKDPNMTDYSLNKTQTSRLFVYSKFKEIADKQSKKQATLIQKIFRYIFGDVNDYKEKWREWVSDPS